jgi:hypothetical protein
MSAQATWISELPEGNHNASFEVEDARSTVALDSDELRGTGLPCIIGKSAVLRRVLDMVRVVAPTAHSVDQRGDRNWQGTDC